MPHYADGTPAKYGDLVVKKESQAGFDVAGVIVSITPQSDSCNGQVIATAIRDSKNVDGAWTPIVPSGQPWYVTLKDCTKVG